MEGWYHNPWHNSGSDAVRGDICAKSLDVTEAEVQKKKTKTEKDQQNQRTPYHDAAFKKEKVSYVAF